MENAKRDHLDFVQNMRDRGVDGGRAARRAGRAGCDPRREAVDPRPAGGAGLGRPAAPHRSRAPRRRPRSKQAVEAIVEEKHRKQKVLAGVEGRLLPRITERRLQLKLRGYIQTQVAIAIEREGRCKTTRCRGVLSAASTAGANRVPFGGRFGKTRRKPGKYRATVLATDAAGQQSAPVTARFRIAGR